MDEGSLDAIYGMEIFWIVSWLFFAFSPPAGLIGCVLFKPAWMFCPMAGTVLQKRMSFIFAEKLLTHGCKEIWGTEVDM